MRRHVARISRKRTIYFNGQITFFIKFNGDILYVVYAYMRNFSYTPYIRIGFFDDVNGKNLMEMINKLFLLNFIKKLRRVTKHLIL